jgi:hypothetical protein
MRRYQVLRLVRQLAAKKVCAVRNGTETAFRPKKAGQISRLFADDFSGPWF